MASVVSVQIGPIRELGTAGETDPMRRPWTSAFIKTPVTGPQRVWAEGIVGDAQADRVNHGGPDKAILGYAHASYDAWAGELPSELRIAGAFGENLTIDGMSEADVCIGDVYRVGDNGVVLEVSQPRQPCWKLGRRFDRKDLPLRVIENGRTGWYFRVRATGAVSAGDAVTRIARPFDGLTIALLNDMFYGRRPIDPTAASCPALSTAWQRQLGAMLERE